MMECSLLKLLKANTRASLSATATNIVYEVGAISQLKLLMVFKKNGRMEDV